LDLNPQILTPVKFPTVITAPAEMQSSFTTSFTFFQTSQVQEFTFTQSNGLLKINDVAMFIRSKDILLPSKSSSRVKEKIKRYKNL